MGGGDGMSEFRISLYSDSTCVALRLARKLSHPLQGNAGNLPTIYLLGFSAALAPKFPPPMARLKFGLLAAFGSYRQFWQLLGSPSQFLTILGSF